MGLMIIQEQIAIERPGGDLGVFIARPDEADAAPFCLLYMDVNGLRDELRGFAVRFAEAGFIAVLPDLYYRLGPGVSFDATVPVHLRSREELARIREVMNALTDPMVVDDTRAIIAHLRDAGVITGDRGGCVGWCMGGRHVLRVMAELPDLFAAGAAHFPTYGVTEAPDSPHRMLANARGEFYVCAGGDDFLLPAERAAALRDALAASGNPFEFTVHPGAGHAYAFAERPATYRREAAEEDWAKTISLFQRTITPGGAAAGAMAPD